jgi:hypothetical protein
MMSGALHRRNRKGRAKARPLQKIETVATDEIAESLIDTFPTRDPQRGYPWPVSAFPSDRRHLAPLENHSISGRRVIEARFQVANSTVFLHGEHLFAMLRANLALLTSV